MLWVGTLGKDRDLYKSQDSCQRGTLWVGHLAGSAGPHEIKSSTVQTQLLVGGRDLVPSEVDAPGGSPRARKTLERNLKPTKDVARRGGPVAATRVLSRAFYRRLRYAARRRLGLSNDLRGLWALSRGGWRGSGMRGTVVPAGGGSRDQCCMRSSVAERLTS